jgi:hypothetical protein
MEESRRPREKGAPQLPPTPTDAPTVDQAFVNDLRVQLLNQQVELQNRPQKASRRAAIGSEFAPNFKIDKVPLEKIDTLAPQQRRFTNDLLQLLKLPNKGSQAQILSSAIAVTERIKDRGETSEDYIEAVELCKRVTNAGTPPWLDPKAAMIATDAKVHLDLLSIPKETRALTNFASGTNNTCCWVNRAGDELDQKNSFLCKPNSRGSVSVIGGVPPQGEVPREALSGCLAKELMLCGIDVPIPETHVIQLASSYFPTEVQSKYTADKLT